MADYKVTDTELTSIANAIRTKGGTQAQLEFPTGFVSAVQAIPTGGGGSDADLSYLPNSDPTKVLASGDYASYSYRGRAELGLLDIVRFGRTLTSTDSQLAIENDGILVGYNHNSTYKITRNLGAPDVDVTCYGVFKWKSEGRLGYILCVPYAHESSKFPLIAIDGSNGNIVTSVWGQDVTYTQYDCREFNVYAIALDSVNKKARFFINGTFLDEKTIIRSGNRVVFGCSRPDDSEVTGQGVESYFKYGGVVAAFESDATIIANMQTIMQKLGIGE